MGLLKRMNTVLLVTTIMPLMACHSVVQLNSKEGSLPAIDGMAKTTTVQEVQKTTVQEVQKQPAQGKVVYLQGKVGKQVPLLGGTAYELQDRTGTIWIKLIGSAPKPGTEIVIKGKLRYQRIPPGHQEQGTVYVEQQKQISKE